MQLEGFGNRQTEMALSKRQELYYILSPITAHCNPYNNFLTLSPPTKRIKLAILNMYYYFFFFLTKREMIYTQASRLVQGSMFESIPTETHFFSSISSFNSIIVIHSRMELGVKLFLLYYSGFFILLLLVHCIRDIFFCRTQFIFPQQFNGHQI